MDSQAEADERKSISIVDFRDNKGNPTSNKKFKLSLGDAMKNQILEGQEDTKARDSLKAEDLEFKSVEPYYDEDLKSWRLDWTQHGSFIPSSKNFQLRWAERDQLLIEQVKTDKNEFSLKLRYPMSILVAFSLSVSFFEPNFQI